jgi:hypothetical protein
MNCTSHDICQVFYQLRTSFCPATATMRPLLAISTNTTMQQTQGIQVHVFTSRSGKEKASVAPIRAVTVPLVTLLCLQHHHITCKPARLVRPAAKYPYHHTELFMAIFLLHHTVTNTQAALTVWLLGSHIQF